MRAQIGFPILKRNMPTLIESLHVVRHLRDADNLVLNGTDNPLVPDQDNIASEFCNRLVFEAKKDGYRGIVMITSPKKRAFETAQILQGEILRSENSFKVSIILCSNLRELDQGKFIFPSEYKPGDFFEPLAEAWKIFWSETFIDKHNLLYHFGSPYSGTERLYPNLQNSFESCGECYRDYAVRLYSAIYDFGQRLNRFRSLKPVVITHDSPRVIFQELEYIAKLVQDNVINIAPGSLPQLTWDTYSTHELSHLKFGEISTITPVALLDSKIQKILQTEIEFLSKM
jgi:broad specificity phosphatase PhoE